MTVEERLLAFLGPDGPVACRTVWPVEVQYKQGRNQLPAAAVKAMGSRFPTAIRTREGILDFVATDGEAQTEDSRVFQIDLIDRSYQKVIEVYGKFVEGFHIEPGILVMDAPYDGRPEDPALEQYFMRMFYIKVRSDPDEWRGNP